jgi:hypothetical protein
MELAQSGRRRLGLHDGSGPALLAEAADLCAEFGDGASLAEALWRLGSARFRLRDDAHQRVSGRRTGSVGFRGLAPARPCSV